MRPILTLPDERLRQQAHPVTKFDASLCALLDELVAVMRHGPGGVGIAAPQIGDTAAVIVVDCRRARRSCRNHGLLCLVNPEIVAHSDEEVLGREGCLSVPEWVGMVPRAGSVRVRYQDAHGFSCEVESSGFEARVLQHEIDHLHGILFIDRMVSTHDLVRRGQVRAGP